MDNWLRKAVCQRTPINSGYGAVLWTRELLAELLREAFNIEVVGTNIGLHLKHMGLSRQKPWFRVHELNRRKVEYFLHDTIPKIQRLAERIEADSAFEDEVGVGLQSYSGKTWEEVGETPGVAVTAKRDGYNLLRRAKKIDYFVRTHRRKIRVYFLLRYSPEMNPDEQAWNIVKSKQIAKQFVTTKTELKKEISSALRSLQHKAEMVQSFFRLPYKKYATFYMY
jgi:transposase